MDRDLDQRARAHATAHRVTDSSVTEAALLKYLDEGVDEDLVIRRLDAVIQAVQHVEHDIEVLAGAFAVFARFSFFSVPRLTPEDHQRLDSTYKQFLRTVSQRLRAGVRFAREVRDVDSPPPARQGTGPDGGGRKAGASE